MSAVNPPKRIAIVDRTTMKGDELDVLFPRPHPVARRTAAYAYTGSLGVNQIASIALADDQVEVIERRRPDALARAVRDVTATARRSSATAEISGQLLVFDLAQPAQAARS